MNYIVFDLEFNQSFNFGKEHSIPTRPACPFEIIDLGAVKLDENLKVVGNFDHLVKPKIYTRLHPFVKKITGIKKSDLKSAKSFKEVYREFVDFIGSNAVLCVWGTADIKELLRNIEYHKLDTSPIPDKYIDVQRHANRYLEQPANTSVGLGNAVKLLNIPEELGYHNAFNDAHYTAEVFTKIHDKNIKPETYSLYRKKQPDNTWKTNLDMNKLVEQFEKMFNREMTVEDKAVIKLAYKMGYTKQFQKAITPSDK